MKWEYNAVTHTATETNLQKVLDTHGSKGWELTAVVPFTDVLNIFVFKRPVAEKTKTSKEP